jgi:hypothetical protein
MAIESIKLRCALPCFARAEEEEATCSRMIRIAAVALGGIALLVGILILIGIPELYAFGTTEGVIFAAIGTIIVLAGLCLQGVQARTPKIGDKSQTLLFDSFQWCNDSEYRKQHLRANTWFSEDNSAENIKRILCIPPAEYSIIEYNRLPERVQKDFYAALQDYPHLAYAFYNKRCVDTIEMIGEEDIARYWGRKTIRYWGRETIDSYPQGEYEKLSPVLQKKLLRCTLIYHDSILDSIIDGNFVFACALIRQTERFADSNARQEEFKMIFDLLMDKKFPLGTFWEKYTNYIKNNSILLREFPLFYVKEALKWDNYERLISAMFLPAANNALLPDIMSQLEGSQQKDLCCILSKKPTLSLSKNSVA